MTQPQIYLFYLCTSPFPHQNYQKEEIFLNRLERRPHILLYHIILIILKAMVLAIKSESCWTFPQGIYKAAAALSSACFCILPHLWLEFCSLFVFKAQPGI